MFEEFDEFTEGQNVKEGGNLLGNDVQFISAGELPVDFGMFRDWCSAQGTPIDIEVLMALGTKYSMMSFVLKDVVLRVSGQLRLLDMELPTKEEYLQLHKRDPHLIQSIQLVAGHSLNKVKLRTDEAKNVGLLALEYYLDHPHLKTEDSSNGQLSEVKHNLIEHAKTLSNGNLSIQELAKLASAHNILTAEDKSANTTINTVNVDNSKTVNSNSQNISIVTLNNLLKVQSSASVPAVYDIRTEKAEEDGTLKLEKVIKERLDGARDIR